MYRYERQCQECGLWYEMDYWTHPDKFICPHCRNREELSDNKAVKSLKRMKRKLGVTAS